ncbi:hypothetical protein [uncultured Dubosiella sp.]|uniref:hypothetical protein n=1 Tax=uncultured Dubosiella sp. TaxID=1937011 RepID=UPI0027318B7D|nr:hypothetical protein [uncultured Dubosiella sp.]
MFYEKQSKEEQEAYKKILSQIGLMSNLFSDSLKPALYYRAHENAFCKYFKADNLARHDCSADAKKGDIGIGLKTWVGSNNQKVAEFGKLKKELDPLEGLELVKKVSEFRNSRIITTMNMYGIKEMVYHVVIREDRKMELWEGDFPLIDIKNIHLIPQRGGKNTVYFTDGKHTYDFNKAKTTLYMVFDDMEKMDEFPVEIMDDPFEMMMNIGAQQVGDTQYAGSNFESKKPRYRELALKLYTMHKGVPMVERKSGLNQWNAAGRKRHPDEVYIPFNKKDRERPANKGFFPPRDQPFDLRLPDGKYISAKVCQSDGKAIMSNPNKLLGKWLLRDVLGLEEWTLITYDMLQEKGFDTVLFTKYDESHYAIDFTESDVYNKLYNIDEE